VIARKTGKRVKLYSRPGNDLTKRFPLITEAVARLKARSCIIDGEAVACGSDGIARFDLIRDMGLGKRRAGVPARLRLDQVERG
jgi:bifunctional non-homologous end joining protein LigD